MKNKHFVFAAIVFLGVSLTACVTKVNNERVQESVKTDKTAVKRLALSRLESIRYSQAVEKHLSLPDTKSDARYSAEFSMSVKPDGSPDSVQLLTPSGSNEFDDLAKKAIAAAAPFPVPRYEKVEFSVQTPALKKNVKVLKAKPATP